MKRLDVMEIELVKIKLNNKDREGCYFNDKVVVAISPDVAEEIVNQYEELALRERSSYLRQGVYRKICDGFREILDVWRDKRR